MRNVFLVLTREYLQRVRTRAFVIGTIAAPLLMLGFILVPAVFAARGNASDQRIALVDETGVLAEGLVPRLTASGFEVEVVEPGSQAEEDARADAVDGELAGLLEVDAETLERGSARWTGESPPSAFRNLSIRQAVSQTALAVRLGDSASDQAVVALLEGGSLSVQLLDPEGPDEAARATGAVAGFGGAFILYMVLLIYGTMVLRAVLEEKTGRIVEVIISSLQPWELMLGKVLGVGAVGLTQVAIWVVSGALILSLGVPTMMAFLPDPDVLDGVREALPGAGVALFFLVCFLLGYFIYASLFAAVAAMCSTEQEAQQLQFPIVMLVVVPIIILAPVIDNPTSTFAVVTSLVPFFSPILMFARVASGAAEFWEAALSVVLMIGTLFATAWVGGRIYRVGILMQGKRPTLPELWRWIREA